MSPCPAGRYGSAEDAINGTLIKDACSGSCAPGHYCPAGSNSSTSVMCPAGTYRESEGAKNVTDCYPCDEAAYCPKGSTAVIRCAEDKTTLGNDAADISDCGALASCRAGRIWTVLHSFRSPLSLRVQFAAEPVSGCSTAIRHSNACNATTPLRTAACPVSSNPNCSCTLATGVTA